MKNVIILAVMVLVQSVAFANNGNPDKDHSRIYVKANEAKSLTLRLINLERTATKIYVTDAEGVRLLTKKINDSEGAALKLDFNTLPAGAYNLFIERANKSYIQSLAIENGELVIGEMKAIVKPEIKVNKKSFIVADPSASVKKVSIIDRTGSVVYTKDYTTIEGGKIRFKLADVPAGKYTVEVRTANAAYTKALEIK